MYIESEKFVKTRAYIHPYTRSYLSSFYYLFTNSLFNDAVSSSDHDVEW
jgi:hypothetical protein